MPFIHIKSLPFDKPFDVSKVIEDISKDFAKTVGIGLEHVTATWQFLPPGHYANAGRTVLCQPADSHPVLVDFLAPDFNTPAQIKTMLLALAVSISKRAEVPKQNIFINFRRAHSGMVFDAGEVIQW